MCLFKPLLFKIVRKWKFKDVFPTFYAKQTILEQEKPLQTQTNSLQKEDLNFSFLNETQYSVYSW